MHNQSPTLRRHLRKNIKSPKNDEQQTIRAKHRRQDFALLLSLFLSVLPMTMTTKEAYFFPFCLGMNTHPVICL